MARDLRRLRSDRRGLTALLPPARTTDEMDAPPEPTAPPKRMSRAAKLVAWIVGALLLSAAAALVLSFVIKDRPAVARTHPKPKPPVAAAPVGIRVASACDGFFTTRVTLQWIPSQSAIVDGYVIYRSQSVDGPFRKVELVAGRSSTGYVNDELATATTYYFVLRSTSGSRTGPYSTPPRSEPLPSACSEPSGGSQRPFQPQHVPVAVELTACLRVDPDVFEAEPAVHRHGRVVRQGDAGERAMQALARQGLEQRRIQGRADPAARGLRVGRR